MFLKYSSDVGEKCYCDWITENLKGSMSETYIPLYRKYRPKNLQEVVGQEHVKKALANAINLKKISHAYLFTGPRGTGKTSIARILAKSLNCVNGPTLTPCEECASCIDIKNSTPMDVIEIDAASNRSVEDARNILEKIQYVPTNGKYKIYIIDEVHMLTKEAFNTLLKTLEEPPENVIFILATTEPHKVLETITSRCQRFDFRRITTDDIIAHLKSIAKKEKIKVEDDALFTIAKNAAGGMRDSLALLDQVSVLDNTKTITSEDVNKLLGRLSFDMLNKMADNIIESKPQEAIELLEHIYNAGNEPTQILTNLLGYFKNLLIVKNCTGDELLLDLTQLNGSQIKTLKSQSENVETHQITFLIEKIIYYIKELKTTTNQHLWLEIAVIDLANLAQNTSLLELQERISRLESGGVVQQSAVSFAKPAPAIHATPKVVPSPDVVAKSKMQKTKSEEVYSINTESLRGASEASNDAIQGEDVSIENTTSPQSSPRSGEGASASNVQQDKQEEDFSPIPVSHHKETSSDSGLSGLWLSLLQNISSTPTVSLLNQHTVPIEISEEKIVIGCKENFVKLVGSDSKKSMIEEGAKKLFGKSISIIIKTAAAEDFQAGEKKKVAPAKKEIPQKTPVEDNSEEEEYIEHELSKSGKNSKKEENFVPSDQVSMVVKLFDGKYID